MPYVIEPIEHIAREKKRGVLYITFNPVYSPDNWVDGKLIYDYLESRWYWDECPKRNELIMWLDSNGYTWVECDVSSYKSPSYLTYEGSIYVDIAYELSDPKYMKLQEHMERPDGKMKDPDVILWFLPAERAFESIHNAQEKT